MITRITNRLIYEGILKPKYRKGEKCIIMYHGIDKTENMSFNRRFFSDTNFAKHLKYYKKHYNVISLADFFENKNIEKDKVNIAITFDDGYLNNFKYALPLLEQYSLPATFFITGLNNNNTNILWADLVEICSYYMNESKITFDGQIFHKDSENKFSELIKYIKLNPISDKPLFEDLKTKLIKSSNVDLNNKDLLDYYELVNPEDIKSIGKSKYITIGSHGFYHNNLGNIKTSSAIKEITESKKYLESLIQYEVNSIGYPDGSYTKQLRNEALKLGFKYQCAVDYKCEDDRSLSFISNRLGLYPLSSIHFINHQIQKFSYAHSNIHK